MKLDPDLELALRVASRFARDRGLDSGEFWGPAWRGLVKARRGFDPERGHPWRKHLVATVYYKCIDAARESAAVSRTRFKRGAWKPASLEAELPRRHDGDAPASLRDGVPGREPDPAEAFETKHDAEEYLRRSAPRRRVLLESAAHGRTQVITAMMLGTSESRVSQLLKREHLS